MSPALVESSSAAPPALWDPRDNVPESVRGFLEQKQPNNMLAFLNVVQQLKVQKRTGWLDYQMTECESIADHMYRMSIISLLIANPDVNRDRCVRIALVHDMAEALVGDITPVDPIGKDEKHRREEATMRYVCDEIVRPISAAGAREMLADFLEYESIGSLEARYVKDIDKYELLVQCFEYEQAHGGKLNFQEFFVAREWIATPEVSKWADDLIEARRAYFDSLEK
ncbi:5'-deoxynucleotidase [Maudiozyma humilis]|uniref:5'-deoxynucleotidase n=1 Tax=Maudiozyma humilis TaxID=51915 RepID=A0AAV5S227_MAUHU|nr:5'-deoxynucleotidase [Kazachstania humilis]